MNESKEFWFWLRKINERLTILFQHKVPNKMELDELDEEVIKNLYVMFLKSDLFTASEPPLAEELIAQLTIMEEIEGGKSFAE